jgi:hypothetical protein
LNYFNYFTEIEDTFVRRRGKHLLLSTIDWALIESWKAMDIPLHVALRGIEKAFDSWEAKPRKRSIKSLLYCQEEVEAQYAEWLEAHAGANAPDVNGSSDAASESSSPFSKAALQEHLNRCTASLTTLANNRSRIREDQLSESLIRATNLLEQLQNELSSSTVPNAQKLETSLTGLERMLSEAILSVAPEEELAALKLETKEQLKPYRSQMDKVVYEQTFNNLFQKRLREHFAVPRLSLFYL